MSTSASKEEIERTLRAWWDYLDRKLITHPLGGVTNRMLEDGTDRTLKFSLVEGVAPELSGLGRLVDAKRPHVYAEGTKTPYTIVRVGELEDGAAYRFLKPNHLHPKFKSRCPDLDLFRLHVYSTNDLDCVTGIFSDVNLKEVLFLTREFLTTESSPYAYAYSLCGGWYELHITGFLNFYKHKKYEVSRATSAEVGIVHESIVDAKAKIS